MLNLKDSFAKIEDNEMFLYGMHISPYEQGNRYNHKPDRVRKLLLNKREILKIQDKVKKDGVKVYELDDNSYENGLKYLRENLNEPIFTLDDLENNNLYNHVINTLTAR